MGIAAVGYKATQEKRCGNAAGETALWRIIQIGDTGFDHWFVGIVKRQAPDRICDADCRRFDLCEPQPVLYAAPPPPPIPEICNDGQDNDGDGLIDEDFGAISNQMFRCVMRDNTARIVEALPEHEPLGLRIVQNSYAWGNDDSDDFDDSGYRDNDDDEYEYDEIGLPFLANLGRVIYDFELKRERAFAPDLSRFDIDYAD